MKHCKTGCMINYVCVRGVHLQRYLSSDPKTLDAKNMWTDILVSANSILSTFEAQSFRKSELLQARERWDGRAHTIRYISCY